MPRMIRENLSWVKGELGVFLKQKHVYHSQFVFTDGPDEVDPLLGELGSDPNPPQKQEFSYGIGTLDHRGGPSNSIKSLPNLLWIGASVLVLLAAWYVAKSVGVF